MKYQTTPAFERDYRRLPPQHRAAFRAAVTRFNACAEDAARGVADPWTRGLRVKAVRGTSGIWEMTWSMDEPDGRATWEWIEIDGAPAVRWRRIGGHAVLRRP